MERAERSERSLASGAILAVGLAAGLFLALFSDAPVTGAAANFTPNAAASELVRLLNGERTTHGLPALAVDPFLAWVTRDGPVPCPNGGPIAEGRAKDLAISGTLSHTLRLCPAYDIGSPMDAWGYRGAMGEILAENGGYDFNPFPYQWGCDVHQANCTGATTSAPTTVALASYQFMTSQGHRDNVLSPLFDRFGCGAWQVPDPDPTIRISTTYACLFASGPGTATVGGSTPKPTPAPTPTSKPTASAPVSSSTPKPTPAPTPTSKPISTPTARPVAERTASASPSTMTGSPRPTVTADALTDATADATPAVVLHPAGTASPSASASGSPQVVGSTELTSAQPGIVGALPPVQRSTGGGPTLLTLAFAAFPAVLGGALFFLVSRPRRIKTN